MQSTKQLAIVISRINDAHFFAVGTEVQIKGQETDGSIRSIGQAITNDGIITQWLDLSEIAIMLPYNPS